MQFTQEEQKALAEYEELKLEEKKLSARIEELKPVILAFIPEDKVLDLENGALKVERRSKWVFTKATQDAEEQLKQRKEDEKRTGEAREIPGDPFLKYDQAK